jgi:hypothetical protein
MSGNISREEKCGPSRTAQTEQEGTRATVEQRKPRPCEDLGPGGFRFDDPYWDDVFDSWHNPTLRTCCR